MVLLDYKYRHPVIFEALYKYECVFNIGVDIERTDRIYRTGNHGKTHVSESSQGRISGHCI
jgi:hypothetical protein